VTVDLADERGGVALGGLRGLVIMLVTAAVLLIEIGAIVTNFYQLDDLSGRAAMAAADAWREAATSASLMGAVDDVVGDSAQVQRVEVSREDGTVAVSLRRAPSVLVLDHVPPLRERLSPTVTREATLDPGSL
jgi:hypothetical protein